MVLDQEHRVPGIHQPIQDDEPYEGFLELT
jgi:hypothetical protein